MLNNPLRYIDPTGHFTNDQIKEYLQFEYGGYWEMYWEAWQADPYFMWVLHEAQYGYTISTIAGDGPGNGIFQPNGNTFVVQGADGAIRLHNYQAKGPYALYNATGNKIKDTWVGEPREDAPLDQTLVNQSRKSVYQPIYDYQGGYGYPVFTGQWRLAYYQAQPYRLDITRGTGVWAAISIGSKILQIAIPFPLTLTSSANQAIRTRDVLVVSVISAPVTSQSPNGILQPAPYSSFWTTNPNGPQYPLPPQW